uniref:Pentacotripeptide-repeat region of PRORP domain-containing protein n=1 Tax=Brassica oleracea var. oleracea TaxID=109376 RepID=A0A0D3AD30_BRAOL
MSLKGLAANTVTYTVFIQGYCLVGKPNVAQEMFNQMGSHNAPPDIRTYNVLLDGLCCNGKVEKLLMIFEYMRKREMDVSIVTYTIVIQGMCKVDKVEDAFDLFCSLFSKGMKPTVVTYTTMITRFCRRGLIHEADALFRKMKQDGFLPNEPVSGEDTQVIVYIRCSLDLPYVDSYMSSVMIHGMCKVDKVEDAFDLFCSLFSKGMKPTVVTYTTMITRFCRRGLIHEADALFRKMKEDGFLRNERVA